MECLANTLHVRYINVKRFNNGKHAVIYRSRQPNRHLLKLTISIPTNQNTSSKSDPYHLCITIGSEGCMVEWVICAYPSDLAESIIITYERFGGAAEVRLR